MPRKVSKKTRRNERITSLVSVEERRRIDAFAKDQRLGISELIRHAVISQVEVWESKK